MMIILFSLSKTIQQRSNIKCTLYQRPKGCKKVKKKQVKNNTSQIEIDRYSLFIGNHLKEKCGKVVLQTMIYFSGQPLFLNQKKGTFMV